MKFSLISSTKKHLDIEKVTWVTLPTASGEIGVYPGHVPLVGVVRPGILKVHTDGGIQNFAVGGGVFETDGLHLDVLADMVDDGTGKDASTIEDRKKQAQRLMLEAGEKGIQDLDTYIKAQQELNKVAALEQIVRNV